MTPQEFAQRIREKYPQYAEVDDIRLTKAVIQKYPQYASQVDMSLAERENQPSTFMGDLRGDVSETLSGIGSDFQERAEKTGEIGQAQKSGEQGLARSLFQRVGQATGLASDVIGRTVVGAGKAILPQKAEEAVGDVVESGVSKVAGLDSVQNLLQRYKQLQQENPALARDIESALNIGTLAADVATAGIGGRGANLATRGVNRAIDVGESGARATGRGARRVGFELEGALTGTSQETLEEAFQASFRGGKEATEFTRAMRGQTTPEGLVENVREATSRIRSTNSAEYARNLQPIANEVVNTSKVSSQLRNKLNEFKVKVTKDGLDFSQSRFRTVPNAQTKIEQAFIELERLGDNTTLSQIDTTRQALRELTLVGDDASARSANALIEEAISAVRDSGKQISGYDDLLKNFGENAEFLDEITRSLSSGDRATVDTAYRKLATSLKTNNERRMNLLRELDEATGGAILSEISGQQLSEVLPRGLFRQISAGLVGVGAVTGGFSSSMLVPMVFASPRVAGEVIRALGLGSQKTKIIIDAIDSARRTLDEINVPVPLASPASEGLQETQEE